MRKLLLATIVGCMFAGSAQASIIFELKNVKFSDGATASGRFFTDDAATSVSGYQIDTNAGSFFPFGNPNQGSAPVSSFGYNDESSEGSITSYDGLTRVSFAVPNDPDFGRSITFLFGTPSSAGERFVKGYEGAFIFGRDIVEGTILASRGVGGPIVAGGVPEPSTWALMIGGFAMVGLGVRRRNTPATLAA